MVTTKTQTPYRPLVIALTVIGLFILFLVIGVKSYNEQDERVGKQVAAEQLENAEAIKRSHVLIGMSTQQCRAAWGEPDHVNSTVTGDHIYERWVYSRAPGDLIGTRGVVLNFTDNVLVEASR